MIRCKKNAAMPVKMAANETTLALIASSLIG